MIKKISFAAALFAVVALVSCGKSKEQAADSDSLVGETAILVEESAVVTDSDTVISGEAEVVTAAPVADSATAK